jgi:ornithine--oxo-acid transaminase
MFRWTIQDMTDLWDRPSWAQNEASMSGFIASMLDERNGQQFQLHEQFLNPQLVKVLRTIGFDRNYRKARGAYLFDDRGDRYLDLMSGWGALALGRNHPVVNAALHEVLDLDLPNLGQMDSSLLSGLLAEQLVATTPGRELDAVFFTNSGTEAVEGAIKFARRATGREGLVYCSHAFHGLSLGALSLNGERQFRDGFGPYLPGCREIPFNDLEALERALHGDGVAAFLVEPIQGKGVHMPSEGYLAEAGRLCRKYGTLFVVDEIQTGLGRTGAMWAVEHWGAEPDILCCAKTLSGGQVPVGAILCRKKIHRAVFSNMDRAVVHSSTFGQNNLAMAAGLATLRVLREERLVEHAARLGEVFLRGLSELKARYEFVKDVRGKGLMIGVEFGRPESLRLKAAWKLLAMANESLFSQMILMPLFKDHRILAQVAGHNSNVIKLLPPLVITEDDCASVVTALDQVLQRCHQVPGSIWEFGTHLAKHAVAAGR